MTRKEKRIAYLGFDDRWFSMIGILFIGLSAVYIFSIDGLSQLTTIEIILTFVASLFFSTFDWIINRSILIRLRMAFPRLQDSTKRITLLLLSTFATVTFVDYLGVSLIGLLSDNVRYDFMERLRALVQVIFLTTMTMAIYEAIYFFVLLQKSTREKEQAKQAIIQAELDTLRNQAQPHFFFNTLNTLRDIIDQSPKEEAKQFVDKLSEIYRYLLEAGNANLVSLQAELKFAQAYIHVQSERFGQNLRVQWELPADAKNKMIAPMSLQLLLENAIKHNVVSRTKPLEIEVSASTDQIVVSNKVQPKSTQLPSTKMGLKNIEKRYALITDRAVRIENKDDQFTVTLPLLDQTTQKDT